MEGAAPVRGSAVRGRPKSRVSKRLEATARVYLEPAEPKCRGQPRREWCSSTEPAAAYDAVADSHCTYTSGDAFASSPFNVAMKACAGRYQENLVAMPTRTHVPRWPRPLHRYRPETPDFTESATHFSSDAIRPYSVSLGRSVPSLHFEGVSPRNWFRLQALQLRAFHDDGWVDLIQADALHALPANYARDCASPAGRRSLFRFAKCIFLEGDDDNHDASAGLREAGPPRQSPMSLNPSVEEEEEEEETRVSRASDHGAARASSRKVIAVLSASSTSRSTVASPRSPRLTQPWIMSGYFLKRHLE